MSEQLPHESIATADMAERFTRDCAERGCLVIHQGGGTCLDRLRSARGALDHGEQPSPGPRWGLEPGSATRAYTERVAAGEGLCRACRARLILDAGEYVTPGPKEWHA